MLLPFYGLATALRLAVSCAIGLANYSISDDSFNKWGGLAVFTLALFGSLIRKSRSPVLVNAESPTEGGQVDIEYSG